MSYVVACINNWFIRASLESTVIWKVRLDRGIFAVVPQGEDNFRWYLELVNDLWNLFELSKLLLSPWKFLLGNFNKSVEKK